MVVIFILGFGLLLIPYTIGLLVNPDLGQALMLTLIAGSFVAAVTNVLKYH